MQRSTHELRAAESQLCLREGSAPAADSCSCPLHESAAVRCEHASKDVLLSRFAGSVSCTEKSEE
eukprot:5205046-Pleurochrysis_carterae.AAC.1